MKQAFIVCSPGLRGQLQSLPVRVPCRKQNKKYCENDVKKQSNAYVYTPVFHIIKWQSSISYYIPFSSHKWVTPQLYPLCGALTIPFPPAEWRDNEPSAQGVEQGLAPDPFVSGDHPQNGVECAYAQRIVIGNGQP